MKSKAKVGKSVQPQKPQPVGIEGLEEIFTFDSCSRYAQDTLYHADGRWYLGSRSEKTATPCTVLAALNWYVRLEETSTESTGSIAPLVEAALKGQTLDGYIRVKIDPYLWGALNEFALKESKTPEEMMQNLLKFEDFLLALDEWIIKKRRP